jgi:hypothetical protein
MQSKSRSQPCHSDAGQTEQAPFDQEGVLRTAAPERAVEMVERAIQSIDGLIAYAANISEVSGRGVQHYREMADEAEKEAEEAQRRLTSLKGDHEALLRDSRTRIDELEQKARNQAQELDKLRAILWPRQGRT